MTFPIQPGRLLAPRTGPSLSLALALGLLLLAAVACGGIESGATAATLPTNNPPPTATQTPLPTATNTPQPTPAATGVATSTTKSPAVSLPDDEGAHLTPIEWWYFNGFLTDDTGAEYSFHYVTFQSVLPNGLTPRLLPAS